MRKKLRKRKYRDDMKSKEGSKNFMRIRARGNEETTRMSSNYFIEIVKNKPMRRNVLKVRLI
jgi:hypothetical protein